MQLNRNQPFAKSIDEGKPTTYIQNGIRFDANGEAVDENEVKEYHAKQAAEAQRVADEAMEAANAAQAAADSAREAGGVTKAAVKKAAAKK